MFPGCLYNKRKVYGSCLVPTTSHPLVSPGFLSLRHSFRVIVIQRLRGDGAAAEAKVSEPGSSTLQEVRLAPTTDIQCNTYRENHGVMWRLEHGIRLKVGCQC